MEWSFEAEALRAGWVSLDSKVDGTSAGVSVGLSWCDAASVENHLGRTRLRGRRKKNHAMKRRGFVPSSAPTIISDHCGGLTSRPARCSRREFHCMSFSRFSRKRYLDIFASFPSRDQSRAFLGGAGTWDPSSAKSIGLTKK